ncbi:MAG: 50S ribosomal protein L13 [Planctomycetota bacterium]
MTRTTFATREDHEQAVSKWHVVDASEHVMGRMASRIAEVLMGKHRPDYTPHISVGEGVIVINASRTGVTGQKRETRTYFKWTGFVGGKSRTSLGERLDNDSEKLIKDAVRRMLPKNRIGRSMLKRLKVYAGADHPHQAQTPTKLEIPS